MANQFEKDMHEKMEELRISPSASVWENVDKRLKTARRKKRFIWIGLLCLFLVSAWIIFYSPSKTDRHQAVESRKIIDSTTGSRTMEPNFHKNEIEYADGAATEKGNTVAGEKVMAAINGKHSTSRKNYIQSELLHSHTTSVDTTGMKTESELLDDGKAEELKPLPGDGLIVFRDAYAGDTSTHKNYFNMEPEAPSMMLSEVNGPTDSIPGDAKNRENLKQKNRRWEIGFSVHPGLTLTGNLFSENKNSSGFYNSGGTPPPIVEPPVGYPFDIKNNFGFEAGAYIRKPIAERLSLTAGLNYQYFSALVKISETVQSGNYNYMRTYQSRNGFHHIAIPIGIQADPGNKGFISWDVGFSVTRFIGSNALNIDSALTFHDNKVFNKINFGLNGALLFSVLNNANYRFSLGPYYYFNLNRIAGAGIYKDDRFSLIGLKAQLLLKKNK